MAESFRLPEPATGGASDFPASAGGPRRSLAMAPIAAVSNEPTTLVVTPMRGLVEETSPVVECTQDSTLALPTPVGDGVDDTSNGSLPALPSV